MSKYKITLDRGGGQSETVSVEGVHVMTGEHSVDVVNAENDVVFSAPTTRVISVVRGEA